jgi:DNA-binding transcriptional LysR family regulator
LGATQPTVSRRLQALERSLGTRLLQRSTHAMTLTEDGARCYERAKSLIGGWDAFESDVRGGKVEPEGTLRVIVPHAFGQQQLVAPLAEYLRHHPGVAVDWLLHDSVPDFIAGGIDCAIHVGPLVDDTTVAVKLADVPRIVVAAPSVLPQGRVPVHARELATLPWLALRNFYRTEVSLEHSGGGHHRFGIRPRVSTDSVFALRSAALAGVGACIASEWVVADDVAMGRLAHLAPDWHATPLPVHLLYPYAQFYPAKLRRFVEVLRASLPHGLGQPAP